MKKQTKTDQTEMTFNTVMVDAIKAEQVVETGKAKKGIVSQELMELAGKFVKGKKFDLGGAPNGLKEFRSETPTGFLGACYDAEQWAKSDDAGLNKVEKIPTCWSTAKSNIKAAYADFGLLVTAFDSESALRKELNDKRKERNAEGNDSTAMPEATAENTKLMQLFGVISGQYDKLDDENKDALLDDLEGVFSHYAAILDSLVPDAPKPPAKQAAINTH